MKTNSETLASWKKLNTEISQLTEKDLEQLLKLERANKRRPMILRRLHQRLTKLRTTREREELRRNP